LQDTLNRMSVLGRRAAGLASEPETRAHARTAGSSMASAAQRMRRLGWREAAGDPKVRRDLDTAVNALAAIIDRVEPPRRVRGLRTLASAGIIAGGVYLLDRTWRARVEPEGSTDSPA